MSGERKVTVRVAAGRSLKAVAELNEEAAQLRELLAHATEFTFRPDYGDLNDAFSDDPEHGDAIVLAWRGPYMGNGDPDRWAILHRGRWCWSKSNSAFIFEPSPSGRDEDFATDCRFSRDEAVALVPQLLRKIEAQRIPQLHAMVEARR